MGFYFSCIDKNVLEDSHSVCVAMCMCVLRVTFELAFQSLQTVLASGDPICCARVTAAAVCSNRYRLASRETHTHTRLPNEKNNSC